MNKSYTKLFWSHVESEKEKSKIASKVYSWLDHDNLGNIITDGKVFWIELTYSGASCPQYVRDYLKRYMLKNGYTYLYND